MRQASSFIYAANYKPIEFGINHLPHEFVTELAVECVRTAEILLAEIEKREKQ